MIFLLENDGDRRQVEIHGHGASYTVVDGEDSFAIDAHALAPGWWSMLLGARSYDASVTRDGTVYTVEIDGRRFCFDLSDPARASLRPSTSRADSAGQVVAPMPGRVLRLLVEMGQEVPLGAPLVVVEAMKMENELTASRPGIVTAIAVQEGQSVDAGALLVTIGEAAAE